MDGFPHLHHHQQQSSGNFWHPSSSSPPPPTGYHPPPPPPLTPNIPQNLTHLPSHYHHQQSYGSQLPITPPPQHQPWFFPPQQPTPMPPQASPLSHYPPPYRTQTGFPPPYLPHQHRYPPPPQPHPMPPPPSSAYAPFAQAWDNPSRQQHQLWEYPDRSIPYSNEEDWAAKARAWAATDSMPEINHARSQFSHIGKLEEHEYAYRDHLPKVVAPVDIHLPPLTQSNGRAAYDKDETMVRETGHLTAAPRTNYSSSSVYEQEVPYTYSSSQDNREVMDHRERPHDTLFAACVDEHHFLPGNQPAKSSLDICDQPLDFQPKTTFGLDQLKQLSFSHVDHAANEGMINQNITATSVHTWNSTPASVIFPPISLPPSGTQFDPLFASQPTLPVHSAPTLGGVAVQNFQTPIGPIGTPFGLGVGTSLHSTNFLGDGNGHLNLSERPKKAAVPNWLREEIIKKKSAITNTNSLHSGVVELEDADMPFRKTDQSDNKSLDSRSIEDEDDDEDEVEAARSAAINQEIKRVLTEVLLKVTDELFDEIATKVLHEDELNAEVGGSNNLGNPKLSPSLIIPTSKDSTKTLVPPRAGNTNTGASQISGPDSTGEDPLGLASYDSDASNDDNTDERRGSQSRKVESISQHLEASTSYDHSLKGPRTGKETPNVDTKGDVQKDRKMASPDSREKKWVGQFHAKAPGVSEASENTSSTNYESVCKLGRDDVTNLTSNDTSGNEKVRRSESANRDRNSAKERCDSETNISSAANRISERSHNARGPIKEVTDGSHRNDNQNNRYGNKQKIIMDQMGHKNVKQGTNEREKDSKCNSPSESIKEGRKEISIDKGEKRNGYEGRNEHNRDQKGDYKRDEKQDRAKFARETLRCKLRSKSPVSIARHGKDSSMGSRGSASSEESSDNPQKRRLHSRGGSLSTSPSRSTKRQASRSPHSKHSHSRHSPYSSARRNGRSRSISPLRQRKLSKRE